MNWEAIGAISQGLGSIAVLATLVYLAHQSRATQRALSIQSVQLSAAGVGQGLFTIAASPETAVIWAEAWAGKPLSGRELQIFEITLGGLLTALDGTLVAANLSKGEELGPLVQVWDRAIRGLAQQPAFLALWKSGRAQVSLSDVARQFIESRL